MTTAIHTRVVPDPDNTEPVFFEQTWDLKYRHSLGKTVGGFLEGLRKKELLGRRCPSCERVLFPARSFCDRCHIDTAEWISVDPAGEIAMFTIVYEPFPGMLVEAPYILAYALLDGADTAVAGYLRGVDLSNPAEAAAKVRTGSRVQVVFADAPQGKVTDFWFELVD